MIEKATILDELIIDTVYAMVIVTDKAGRVIRFNAGGCRITGFPEHEVLGRFLWDVFPRPEYRERARQRFGRLLSGEPMRIEADWLTKSGERRRLSCDCVGARGPSGDYEYTVGTGIDVTAQREAEQALRESEERFRSIFADAAIAMALVDERGRYLHVNAAFCELTGYSTDELSRMDLLSITHPDDRQKNAQLFEETVTGRRSGYLFEKRYLCKDGKSILVQVSASIASSERAEPRVIGLFQNISEQRAAEAAQQEAYTALRELSDELEQRVLLRTSELQARTDELTRIKQELEEQSRLLRLILESMGDGVYVADGHGKLVLSNAAAARISGPIDPEYGTATLRAGRPWYYQADGVTACPPEQLPLVRSTRGESVDDQEILVRRPGFPPVWTRATSRPLRDQSGEPAGAVVVVRDVTERHRHEEALRQANASLEQANASLRQSEKHYKELSESNLRLAREVEHRVRNNLQGLLGLVDATRDTAHDVKSFADAMESRLAGLEHVHQLLAETSYKEASLYSLVEGAFRTLQHMAPEPAKVSIDGPDLLVGASQMLPLTLVIVEWFTNSCKYGAHRVRGGVVEVRWVLASAAEPNRVRLTWIERGGPTPAHAVVPSLGTHLVKGFVENELKGTCRLRYPEEGAEYEIVFTPRDAEAPDDNAI